MEQEEDEEEGVRVQGVVEEVELEEVEDSSRGSLRTLDPPEV